MAEKITRQAFEAEIAGSAIGRLKLAAGFAIVECGDECDWQDCAGWRLEGDDAAHVRLMQLAGSGPGWSEVEQGAS